MCVENQEEKKKKGDLNKREKMHSWQFSECKTHE